MKRYFEYIGGNSQKFWEIEVVGRFVRRRWGRIGTNGQIKSESFADDWPAGESATRLILEKISKGYVERTPGTVSPVTAPPATKPIAPMLATELDAPRLLDYASNDNYAFECKLDGDRVMLVIEDGTVCVVGRNGQMSKHAPRFADRAHAPELDRLTSDRCRMIVLDGELVGDTFWIFDMPHLEWSGKTDLLFTPQDPWSNRRRALSLIFQAWRPKPALFRLLPFAEDETDKLELAHRCKAQRGEGIIIKRMDAPYAFGARNQNSLKAKFWRSADLVVTGAKFEGRDNVVLGAHRNGEVVTVGRCSTNGKGDVPIGAVVEVKYLYLGANGKLVQPELLRIRDDKAAEECTHDQLVPVNKEVIL